MPLSTRMRLSPKKTRRQRRESGDEEITTNGDHPMLTADAVVANLETMFETSPLLIPKEDTDARLAEYQILEHIGLPAKAKVDVQPITLKHFADLQELCNIVVAVMNAPRSPQGTFEPLTDTKYDKLYHRFAKSFDLAFSEALSTMPHKLDLSGKNLAQRDKMKLVTEFIWRHGSNLFAMNLSSCVGFDSGSISTLYLPHALLEATPRMSSLNMNETKATQEVCACIAYMVLKRKAYTNIELSRCYVLDTGAALWGLVLQQPSCRLTKLTLSNAKIGDVGVIALAIGLAKSHSLQVLDLSYNMIGRKGVQHIGRALLENPVLRELVLNSNRAGSRGACALASFLLHPDCKLEVLRLEHNDVGPRGGKALCVGLSRNSCLKELYLEHNELENMGVAGFGTCLEVNRSLKYLDLSDCDMSDLGLAAVALGLRVNTTLEHLACSDQVINDAGCLELATSLSMNRFSQLQYLDLHMNMIRNAGMDSLCCWLELKTCRLQQLFLVDNDISDEGARRLGQALLTNAPYSVLINIDLSGNPISTKAYDASLRPINAQQGRFTRISVVLDGAKIVRHNARGFGATVQRYKMTGLYYVFLLVFTLFSQWFDLGFDVYVSYNQMVLALQTQTKLDFTYAALLIFFVASPYLYVIFFFARPEDSSKYNRQGCCSSWTMAKIKLFVINALQMRTAYEIYRSLHSELTTLAFSSVRLAQCVLGAMPQSLIQLHILLSSSNLAIIGQVGITGNWTVFSLLISLCFSFGVTSSTVSYLYEEKFVMNWKRVDFRHEELTYFFGMSLAFVYHLFHYVFRALFLVLIASFFGPVLGVVLVLLGLLVRLIAWWFVGSQRRKFFVVISYIVGIASWDKRRASRICHMFELIELGLVVAPFWIPIELVEQIPNNELFDLGFQRDEWLDLIRVVGPIPLTAVLAGSWLISTYLYFAFIEQLHPYTDVDEICDMASVEALARAPFEVHSKSMLHHKKSQVTEFTNFRISNSGPSARMDYEASMQRKQATVQAFFGHRDTASSAARREDFDLL